MPIWEDENNCWIGDPVEVTCHGCSGKGWVETSDHQAHQCPVCLGSGKYNNNPLIGPYVPQINPYPVYPYNPAPVIPNPPYPGIGYPWVISSDSTKLPINGITSGGNSAGIVGNGKIENVTSRIWSSEK